MIRKVGFRECTVDVYLCRVIAFRRELQLILLAISILFAFNSAAEAQDRPNDESAKLHLLSLISGPMANNVTIEGFRKTDGIAREVDGAKHYTLEFAATLIFNGDMLARLGDNQIVTAAPAATRQGSLDSLYYSVNGWTAIRAGERRELTGSAQYVRYESGWRVVDMAFKTSSNQAAVSDGSSASSNGSSSPSAGASQGRRYPVIPPRSGSRLVTRFAVENKSLRPIQIFLDEEETPIVIQGVSTYQSELEVGTTHLIRAVVQDREFQLEFTVPTVMRRLIVSGRGISVYGR